MHNFPNHIYEQELLKGVGESARLSSALRNNGAVYGTSFVDTLKALKINRILVTTDNDIRPDTGEIKHDWHFILYRK